MKDHSAADTADLTALVGSRLCHDLINPLGAIGNGVELLGMMPGNAKPEVNLIEEAVRDAQARIRYFRIAFGHADAAGRISNREITEIMSGLYGQGGRLTVDWQSRKDLMRTDAKIGLLMLGCVEHALPLGGEVRVTESDGTFRMDTQAKRVTCDPDLWRVFEGGTSGRPLLPAEVQFMLFAQEAKRQDRVVQVTATENSLVVTG